jgi:hypothetical protein
MSRIVIAALTYCSIKIFHAFFGLSSKITEEFFQICPFRLPHLITLHYWKQMSYFIQKFEQNLIPLDLTLYYEVLSCHKEWKLYFVFHNILKTYMGKQHLTSCS